MRFVPLALLTVFSLAACDSYQDPCIVQGDEAATANSVVYVKYIGKLEDDTVFDQSVCSRFELPDLIPGFRNGVAGMKPGEEKILTIPPEEGYGDAQVGSIPPNSTLLFAVMLLSVE